jgi:hypothetical protein
MQLSFSSADFAESIPFRAGHDSTLGGEAPETFLRMFFVDVHLHATHPTKRLQQVIGSHVLVGCSGGEHSGQDETAGAAWLRYTV